MSLNKIGNFFNKAIDLPFRFFRLSGGLALRAMQTLSYTSRIESSDKAREKSLEFSEGQSFVFERFSNQEFMKKQIKIAGEGYDLMIKENQESFLLFCKEFGITSKNQYLHRLKEQWEVGNTNFMQSGVLADRRNLKALPKSFPYAKLTNLLKGDGMGGYSETGDGEILYYTRLDRNGEKGSTRSTTIHE